VWKEELFPALIYCRQLDTLDRTAFSLLEANLSCNDVALRRRGEADETLEITMAFVSQAEGVNPGYQEALRWEKMHADGFVSATAVLTRDKRTRKVEHTEPESARSVDELIQSWVDGLEWSLRRKQRPEYGSGKTLLVYGDGLSGDFEYPRRAMTLQELVKRMNPESWANSFDRTAIVGWHQGWLAFLDRQTP